MNDFSHYFLDTLQEEDAPLLLDWFNDSILCQYMEDSEPDKVYVLDDVLSMVREPSPSVYFCLRFCLQHKYTLVGYASLYDRKPEGEAEFSFMIGNPEFRGRNVGGLFLELVCAKAKALGLKKLTCSVLLKNQPSIRCIQKNGFISVNPSHTNPLELFFEKFL